MRNLARQQVIRYTIIYIARRHKNPPHQRRDGNENNLFCKDLTRKKEEITRRKGEIFAQRDKLLSHMRRKIIYINCDIICLFYR